MTVITFYLHLRGHYCNCHQYRQSSSCRQWYRHRRHHHHHHHLIIIVVVVIIIVIILGDHRSLLHKQNGLLCMIFSETFVNDKNLSVIIIKKLSYLFYKNVHSNHNVAVYAWRVWCINPTVFDETREFDTCTDSTVWFIRYNDIAEAYLIVNMLDDS